MSLPASSLSIVCRSIAQFVHTSLSNNGYPVQVLIGTPFTAAQHSPTEPCLNLFFYRFEPSEFAADGGPGEPFWLRAHCVVTALGVDEDGVSAGESDLAMLGEVMRVFHEQPVMHAMDASGETVRVQLVLSSLGLDDINRLWSTQKDTPYRASLAYEISLVPVVPKRRSIGAPRVGAIGAEVRIDREPRPFIGSAHPVPVVSALIDINAEDWAPQICFLDQGVRAQTVSYEVGSAALSAFVPRVLAAGMIGEPVVLHCELWEKGTGWRDAGVSKNATIAVSRLDAPEISEGAGISFDLPSREAGQVLLYAARSYERSSDGAALQVRSNPLLVSLYGGPS